VFKQDSCRLYLCYLHVCAVCWYLHENIDRTLLNKLHGPLHFKIHGRWTRGLYSVVTTRQSRMNIFHKTTVCVMNSTVSVHTISDHSIRAHCMSYSKIRSL